MRMYTVYKKTENEILSTRTERLNFFEAKKKKERVGNLKAKGLPSQQQFWCGATPRWNGEAVR